MKRSDQFHRFESLVESIKPLTPQQVQAVFAEEYDLGEEDQDLMALINQRKEQFLKESTGLPVFGIKGIEGGFILAGAAKGKLVCLEQHTEGSTSADGSPDLHADVGQEAIVERFKTWGWNAAYMFDRPQFRVFIAAISRACGIGGKFDPSIVQDD